MMKQNKFFRIAAVSTVLALLLTAGAPALNKNVYAASTPTTTSKQATTSLTAGKMADYLTSSVKHYRKGVTKKQLLIAVNLKSSQKLSIEKGLFMISKAFGKLPKATGNNKRLAPKEISLKGISKQYRPALKNLFDAGVLAQSDLRSPESKMPKKQAEKIVRRIFAVYGNRKADDFYQTVNKNALENTEIPPGETDAGGTYDLTARVNKQVAELIQNIAAGSGYAPGSKEQKIKDMYNSALDFKTRNRLGAEPLRKYLDALDQAKNVKELSNSQVLSMNEIHSGGMLNALKGTDYRNNKKKITMIMSPLNPELQKNEFHASNKTYKSTLKLYITLLKLSGESSKDAENHAKAYIQFQKRLSKYTSTPEEYNDTKKMHQIVSPTQLQKMMPGVDVAAHIGTSLEELDIQDPKLFKGFCKLLQQKENLQGIKTGLKISLLSAQYKNLSQAFIDAFDVFNQEVLGQAPGESSPEELASALVSDSLGEYIDQLYVEKYFPKEAKSDVEKMVKKFIEVYKERIQKLDWMSDTTKQKAIRKLDNMVFVIGYPDKWDHSLDGLKITGSYFDNMVALSKLLSEQDESKGFDNDNRGKMVLPATTVNAVYDQFSNTMCFPAGILQAPNYDVNASDEENLAAIGTVIAHEITHAFDQSGAKYDENGMENNWWTTKDQKEFIERCSKVEKFYDGWEAAPGIKIKGTKTRNENIADIGGMACALEVLKQKENPDYDAFFTAYARSWLKCTTRGRAEALADADEHASNNLRVNRVVVNFQEFYDTYGIKKNDGMYVAPKDRISIW